MLHQSRTRYVFDEDAGSSSSEEEEEDSEGREVRLLTRKTPAERPPKTTIECLFSASQTKGVLEQLKQQGEISGDLIALAGPSGSESAALEDGETRTDKGKGKAKEIVHTAPPPALDMDHEMDAPSSSPPCAFDPNISDGVLVPSTQPEDAMVVEEAMNPTDESHGECSV